MLDKLPVETEVQINYLASMNEKSLFLSFASLFFPVLSVADRLLSKRAGELQMQKIELMFRHFEQMVEGKELPASDDFYIAANAINEQIRKTKSKEKIKYFASILAATWNSNEISWDEISQIIKLVGTLEDLHIYILREAQDVDPLRTFRINNKGNAKSVDLSDKFLNHNPIVLELCISDLISQGLLNDTISSNGSPFGSDHNPMPSPAADYSISATGRWLLQRIEEMASEAGAEL